jgi:hypothetical protein
VKLVQARTRPRIDAEDDDEYEDDNGTGLLSAWPSKSTIRGPDYFNKLCF